MVKIKVARFFMAHGVCAKNYENWLRVDKVIAKNAVKTDLLTHPVYFHVIIVVIRMQVSMTNQTAVQRTQITAF